MNWLLALIIAPAVVWMLFSPGTRFLLVMVAGLVVYTPGYASIGPKAIFVALLLLSSAIAFMRLRDAGIRLSGGVQFALIAYLAALTISAGQGLVSDPRSALQNGLSYLLVVLVLPIALDAGTASTRRFLEVAMLIVGFLAALSFMVFWLDKRGVSGIGVQLLFAASVLMPALIFSWGLVTAGDVTGRLPRRFIAIAASLFVPVAFFITGARSGLIFGAGLIGFLVWGIPKRRILQAVLAIAVSTAVAIPFFTWLAANVLSDSGFLSRRAADFERLISYGSAGDGSLRAREYATEAALNSLEGNWLFGLGLSAPNPVTPFDTPLSTVMRLGIIGTFFLVLYIGLALWWAMQIAPRNMRGDSVRGVIISWSLIVIAYGVLISPIEDSLFAFAFGLVIAFAVNAQKHLEAAPFINIEGNPLTDPLKRSAGI